MFRDDPSDPAVQRRFADVVPAAVRCLGSAGHMVRIIEEFNRQHANRPVELAIVSLPAVMTEAVLAIRTQLRRMRIADRFWPTIEDLVNGVGPRTEIEVSAADLILRKPHDLNERAVRSVITGKRVLITGAGGSIGSELARQAAQFEPAELMLMERSENALFEIDRQIARRWPKLKRSVWLHDVVKADETLALCQARRPQTIFHAAAHKHVPMMEDHPVHAVENNFFGTKSIADAAEQTGCERFVMISTDKAVNPTSIMGATKRLAELYIQFMNQKSDDVRFSMVRFGNVLGSAGSVLLTWKDQIREGGPVTVTHRDMMRYFMTIPEAAILVMQAAALEVGKCAEGRCTSGSGGEILLLDMGQPVKILDLARRFIEAHGLTPRVMNEDDAQSGLHLVQSGAGAGEADHLVEDPEVMPIVFTGIRPGEKLFEELAYDSEDMIPTSHPGIKVWKSEPPDANRINIICQTLSMVRKIADPTEVSRLIRDLLPEADDPIVTTAPVPQPGRRVRVA